VYEVCAGVEVVLLIIEEDEVMIFEKEMEKKGKK
jgi:hypothetical protein